MSQQGHVGRIGIDTRKLGMWLFLASECLFFGALIATYLLYRGQSIVGPYPKDVFDIPLKSRGQMTPEQERKELILY